MLISSVSLDDVVDAFVSDISPAIESVSQAQVVNNQIVPALSKLILNFTSNNDDVAGEEIETVANKMTEDFLADSELICQDVGDGVDVDTLADDLLSQLGGAGKECFRENSRLSGTDIGGSVISKDKQETVEDCQEKCAETDECNFFLYFTDEHYQTWKRGECRLLRQQGEYQDDQAGHTSGPKVCDTDQELETEVKIFLTGVNNEIKKIECTRLERQRDFYSSFTTMFKMKLAEVSLTNDESTNLSIIQLVYNKVLNEIKTETKFRSVDIAEVETRTKQTLNDLYSTLINNNLLKSVEIDEEDENENEDEDDWGVEPDFTIDKETEGESEEEMTTVDSSDIDRNLDDESSKPDFEPNAEPDSEPYQESEPEAEPEAEPEFAVETESESEPEPPSQPETESELEPEHSIDSDEESDPETESEPEAESELEPEHSVESDDEDEDEWVSEPEPHQESEPEPDNENKIDVDADEDFDENDAKVIFEGESEVIEPVSMVHNDDKEFTDFFLSMDEDVSLESQLIAESEKKLDEATAMKIVRGTTSTSTAASTTANSGGDRLWQKYFFG